MSVSVRSHQQARLFVVIVTAIALVILGGSVLADEPAPEGSTDIIVTVALLGGPPGYVAPITLEPTSPGFYGPPGSPGGLGMPGALVGGPLGSEGGLGMPGAPLQGDKIMYEAAAGLTTILGPDEATIQRLFGEGARSEAAVLTPSQGVGFAPGFEGGIIYGWPAHQFEFPWPEDRPQYYLEKLPGLSLGYPVYGRIELADKEGYTVSVHPSGRPDALTLLVEFANKTLSGGKYDETIRAFVGRPTLIKVIVTATAPLTKGQKTLLVWQPVPPKMMGPGGIGAGMGGPGEPGGTSVGPTGVAVLLEFQSAE